MEQGGLSFAVYTVKTDNFLSVFECFEQKFFHIAPLTRVTLNTKSRSSKPHLLRLVYTYWIQHTPGFCRCNACTSLVPFHLSGYLMMISSRKCSDKKPKPNFHLAFFDQIWLLLAASVQKLAVAILQTTYANCIRRTHFIQTAGPGDVHTVCFTGVKTPAVEKVYWLSKTPVYDLLVNK